MSFENQIAVVTGASSGIGAAVAQGLAAQGATVCLVGRRLDALSAVAAPTTRGRMLIYRSDLSLPIDIQKLVAHLQHDHGTINLL